MSFWVLKLQKKIVIIWNRVKKIASPERTQSQNYNRADFPGASDFPSYRQRRWGKSIRGVTCPTAYLGYAYSVLCPPTGRLLTIMCYVFSIRNGAWRITARTLFPPSFMNERAEKQPRASTWTQWSSSLRALVTCGDYGIIVGGNCVLGCWLICVDVDWPKQDWPVTSRESLLMN